MVLVGAGVHAVAAAGALLRVDDDQAVFALVDGSLYRARLHAGSLVAVHAQVGPIGHLDLGHRAAHALVELHPELPDLGLRFSDGGPVVAAVLVFAGELAGIAAVADGQIDDEYLLAHCYLPSWTQPLKCRPDA